MKNKTTAKPVARSRKPPEEWPRFFRDMLGQLDVAGDEPVLLAKADITPESQSHVAYLMARGLLSEEPANSIDCISCDAKATIRRKGEKGEMASALCPCCGTIFQTNAQELMQWRADWNSLALWIKKMAVIKGEIESVSPLALFLGHLTKGQERLEVFLARSLSDQALAKQTYSDISQSMHESGIVLSLAGNFSKQANPKMAVVRLSDCLLVSGGKFSLSLPEQAFSGKDQAKQRAGLTRAQNDPRQKQKENLKAFVKSKITGIFADKYHHQIADDIIKKHAGQITYKDSSEKTQQLSRDMVRDAIKDVMRKNGLEDWISGKKFKP
ncbi:MAG: hypothetical protein ACK5XX_01190 [Holosporales bacterium]